jgi:SAM-dependent methyltransferase
MRPIEGVEDRLAGRNYRERIARLFREKGALALAGRIVRSVGHRVVEVGSVTFYFHDIPHDTLEEATPPLSGFSIRQLHPSDKDALLYGSESTWEALLARFAKGDLCFGALDDRGRAVHTRWLSLVGTRIPELDMEFVPTSDAAYFFDGYTRPDARRQGVDGAVRVAIFEALRALGRRRVYSYVRHDNPAGQRAAGRLQTVAGTLRYVRLLGSKVSVSGAEPGRLHEMLRRHDTVNNQRDARAAEWRGWFEGWLKEPVAKRSIGFHELPEDAFKAMAAHIGATLKLDPSRDVVLDVGCDSALVTRFVAPLCERLVGVDFIPGMLIDAQQQRRQRPEELATKRAHFAAADGRALPVPSGIFSKAYCSGVVHTLPTEADSLAMILEMVRSLKPSGQALVAAIPDLSKRGRARRAAFRRGTFGERARIVVAVLVPQGLIRLFRRLQPRHSKPPLRYLEFDLPRVKALLEKRGLACAIFDYPKDFWSRDFRETRSNLLITVPNTVR